MFPNILASIRPIFPECLQKKTGRNFNVYLSSLRLDHATHLLETTTSSIPDISEESGFSSSRAFIEMFKKVNELTPKQYRDQCNEHKKVHHSNDWFFSSDVQACGSSNTAPTFLRILERVWKRLLR